MSDTVPPGTALDVGCGDGVLTRGIAAHRRPVIGVDFAVAALRRGRDLYGDEEDVAFAAAAAPRLPFKANAFSFVFDRGCMHNLPPGTWPAYLEEMSRVLAPGGVFELWFTGNVVAPKTSDRLLRRVKQSLGKAKPREFTPERLGQNLPATLDILGWEQIPYRMRTGQPIVFDRFVLRKRAA